MSNLPPEKLAELKQIINNNLLQNDVQQRIRDAVDNAVDRSGELEKVNEAQLKEALLQQGLVDEVMTQLRFNLSAENENRGLHINTGPKKPATHFHDRNEALKPQSKSAEDVQKANIDPTRRYLYLQVTGGRAFLEHLQEADPLPGQISSTFTLFIHFRGQRFKSRPVPCACEPDFQEGFLLEVHKQEAGDSSRMVDVASMLAISDPIHLVLVRTDPSGDTSLVTSHYLEWRTLLSSKESKGYSAVELLGIGAENKVPVGLLDVKFEIIPKLASSVTDDVVATQVTLERNRRAERDRLFLVYAKQWWKEYLQIRPSHKDRLVKIFAQDENGTNRPVCSYVKPLRAGRLLDTPRQAARFVSLLGYERALQLGGGEKTEVWASMHAMLCRSRGDCEDHAILLCCLLLGFGLDAYICVGTKGRGTPHSWVMTLPPTGTAMFWEALTGHRYIHESIEPDAAPLDKQVKTSHPYKTIGCVFNHENFYANSQSDHAVATCVFNLSDQSRWKAMSSDAISGACGSSTTWPVIPPLCAPALDPALLSNELELQMRALVNEHRMDMGLSTTWDDQLSYILTPALAAYENERVTGTSAGNEEFQQAVRRIVPDGHTFKGYPIQFVHRNARRALATCLKSPVCEEIVHCRGDSVRLALRVRVFCYPESAIAVWMMFACKYKSVV